MNISQSDFNRSYFKEKDELGYNQAWFFSIPCDCGDEDCKWWAMINNEDLLHHIAMNMKIEQGHHWIEFIKKPGEE